MKKNKIYANKLNKRLGNNQSLYNIEKGSKEVVLLEEKNKNDNLTVREKVDELLNRNGYIFNINVKIITIKKEYTTKIAGVVNDRIITLDNEIININDVKDIIIND